MIWRPSQNQENCNSLMLLSKKRTKKKTKTCFPLKFHKHINLLLLGELKCWIILIIIIPQSYHIYCNLSFINISNNRKHSVLLHKQGNYTKHFYINPSHTHTHTQTSDLPYKVNMGFLVMSWLHFHFNHGNGIRQAGEVDSSWLGWLFWLSFLCLTDM